MTCESLCIDCKYFREETGYSTCYCAFDPKEKRNCVTGEMDTEFNDPYKKNKDGTCKDFSPLVSKTISGELEQLKEEFAIAASYSIYKYSRTPPLAWNVTIVSVLLEIIKGSTSMRSQLRRILQSWLFEHDDENEELIEKLLKVL